MLFIRLLIAHLIGDFFLQPTSWVLAREEKGWRAISFYIHLAIHVVLLWVLSGQWHFGLWALALGCVHGCIDLGKTAMRKQLSAASLFLVDQALHLLSLWIAARWYTHQSVFDASWLSSKSFIWMAALILLTQPASIAIRVGIARWTPQIRDRASLLHAGQWIGIFERLLIFVFVMIGQWQGIGFLFAAKSIFRFGDLKDAHDRQLTEYVMLGTLLSFFWAIVIALLAQWVLGISR
ncbi:MAG: DUF3307 domain-containing protein [Thermoflavifilum sp.]|nr:DUF3307 domain-containing protein [Thermoflavifilum sp.]